MARGSRRTTHGWSVPTGGSGRSSGPRPVAMVAGAALVKDPFGRDYASDKFRIKYTKDPLGRWSPVAVQEIGGGQPVDPPKPLYPKPAPTPAPTPGR